MRPLQCYGHLLELGGLSVSDVFRPSSDLLDQFSDSLVPSYHRFDDHLVKHVCAGQTAVLADLVGSFYYNHYAVLLNLLFLSVCNFNRCA